MLLKPHYIKVYLLACKMLSRKYNGYKIAYTLLWFTKGNMCVNIYIQIAFTPK